MIKRDEAGYSMVEVLVAIIILVIAIVPMFAMFDIGLRTATTSGNYDMARALAEKQIELAQSVPYKANDDQDLQSKYPTCNGVSVTTPGEKSNCLDEDPSYEGFEFTVEKSYLELPADLSVEPVELVTCTQSEDDPCAGVQVTIEVYRSSDSELLFTTTGMVTE